MADVVADHLRVELETVSQQVRSASLLVPCLSILASCMTAHHVHRMCSTEFAAP